MECELLVREDSIEVGETSHAESHAVDVETEGGRNATDSSCDLDGEIIRRIPNFPDGKDRHLFVSHSSEDLDRVKAIVEGIENRFKLSCILADRDFQSGKDIITNIKESMQRSMKVLLVLSPNFTRSGWCKYERDFAFMSHIESGVSCVVPVLLEMCEVPETLVTLTYIDATLPGVDIPARIADALTRSELAAGSLPLHEQTLAKKYESGYCLPITAKRNEAMGIRPGVYKFSLDEDVFFHIQSAKIKLPPYVLENVITELNHSKDVWGYGYTYSRPRLCCWTMMAIPIWIYLYSLVYAFVTHVSGRYATNVSSFTVGFSFIWTSLGLAIFTIIVFCCLPKYCHRRARAEVLQTLIWRKVQRKCLKNNVILLFENTRNKAPTLYVMRYDVKQCTDYLAGLIRSRSLGYFDEDLTPEECAKKSIEHHVRQIQRKMTAGLDELPEAPYNRHNVKKGKICLCQDIERKYSVL